MNQPADLIMSVTDFVALFNQTVNYAYPYVVIEGELSNFRVSKNQWVYFDLKDESASLKFFGSVYKLPGPLEEGMKLRVSGTPQLHPQYGFSITIQSVALAGEGTIKKAAKLLEAKLQAEGLFEQTRKRRLPYPPTSIGLITSAESAAYSDFMKIIDARWGGLSINHFDVQVQGEDAPNQIKNAIEYFNTAAQTPDVLVVIRGGGSTDDLQTFSTEMVTRAVAGSRIPTVVAIGHERDDSLAEKAADMRASTPSNAAELLVPDRRDQLEILTNIQQTFQQQVSKRINDETVYLQDLLKNAKTGVQHLIAQQYQRLDDLSLTLEQINPKRVLKRGYAIVRADKRNIRSRREIQARSRVSIEFYDGSIEAEVQ